METAQDRTLQSRPTEESGKTGSAKGKKIKGRERRPPLNFLAIVKDADLDFLALVKDADLDRSSSIDKIYDQLYSGVLLDNKKEKYWVDKCDKNCFMLFARKLDIVWGSEDKHWHWTTMETSGDLDVEVAELLEVCWLDITGKFWTVKLSPGTVYKVSFMVMIKSSSHWSYDLVTLKLVLPNGRNQERQESLQEKPRDQWIEIPLGEFTMSPENVGEIIFSLDQHNSNWKEGLVVKGVAIQPKECLN